VAALATFVPAGFFGIGWAVVGGNGTAVAVAGILAAAGASATVFATGMIYASLRPIRQWHSPYTVPVYLVLALASGATLYAMLLSAFGETAQIAARLAALATLAAWVCKGAAWRHNDRGSAPATVNSATALRGGTVSSVEWPHTAPNYVLKEMAFRVARARAARLRLVCQALAFAAPAALLLVAPMLPPWPRVPVALAAAASQLAGLLVERWLFFAEAEHVAALYYGAGSPSSSR
jgi:DMSO reductase anchor subunit